jgi:hypothetical protein
MTNRFEEKIKVIRKHIKAQELFLTNQTLFESRWPNTEKKPTERIKETIEKYNDKINFYSYCRTYEQNAIKRGHDITARLVNITNTIADEKRKLDSAVMTPAQRKMVFHQKCFHLVNEMEVINEILKK